MQRESQSNETYLDHNRRRLNNESVCIVFINDASMMFGGSTCRKPLDNKAKYRISLQNQIYTVTIVKKQCVKSGRRRTENLCICIPCLLDSDSLTKSSVCS